MKKIISLTYILLLPFFSLSQNLILEFSSGYSRVNTTLKNYSPEVGSSPFGVRLGGGFKHIQIGAEYNSNFVPPTFTYYDQITSLERFKEKFKTNFYGGFIRLSTGADPVNNTSVFFKLGVGAYSVKKEIRLINGQLYPEVLESKANIGFNGNIGVSIPIFKGEQLNRSILHLIVEATGNYCDIKFDNFQNYNILNYGVNLGLSLNLGFYEW